MSRSNNKICICFFGLLRNLKITFPYIQQNVFKVLEQHGVPFDIYLHTYRLDVLNSPRAGENDIRYDNSQIGLFKHPSIQAVAVDDQNEIDQLLRFPQFLRKKNPWPEDPSKTSMKNLLRQYYSLNRVFQMVLEREKEKESTGGKNEYNGFLFLRPDMLYATTFHMIPEIMHRMNKNSFFSSPVDTYGGVNDRFCFTSRYGAEVYSSRIHAIYNEENVHSETFLLKHLNQHGMCLYPLKVLAYRVRANGQIKY